MQYRHGSSAAKIAESPPALRSLSSISFTVGDFLSSAARTFSSRSHSGGTILAAVELATPTSLDHDFPTREVDMNLRVRRAANHLSGRPSIVCSLVKQHLVRVALFAYCLPWMRSACTTLFQISLQQAAMSCDQALPCGHPAWLPVDRVFFTLLSKYRLEFAQRVSDISIKRNTGQRAWAYDSLPSMPTWYIVPAHTPDSAMCRSSSESNQCFNSSPRTPKMIVTLLLSSLIGSHAPVLLLMLHRSSAVSGMW